ncbi:Rv3654c family TadE-like protein [Nocardia sp. CA-290969]|uniref:Rv3654c family TadE-like protein n=1 Tax=Nocardia sp. CA-290969 TaxID=3239986 RepID=UPI003D94D78A
MSLATAVGGFVGTAAGVVIGGITGCLRGLPLFRLGRWDSSEPAAAARRRPVRVSSSNSESLTRASGRQFGHLRGDNGSATVIACFAVAALIALTVLVTQIGGVVVARHRAQAAADLSALAAAAGLRDGAEAGCTAAESLGRRMRAAITRCEVEGWDVLIEVEEKVPVGPFGARRIRAIARAGPVEEGR